MAHSAEILATTLFAIAVLHTFLSSSLQKLASRFEDDSIGENLFHLLGEVEVVFGLWAGVLVALLAIFFGREHAVEYTEKLNFTEPLFVFAIMTVAATRPVVNLARSVVMTGSKLIPGGGEIAIFISCLTLGPLLGSFITEPAAMTVTALILKERYYDRPNLSIRFKYIALAVLFVNISVGGVLTPFAAPPVLMVAAKWQWDTAFMLETFGWKAAVAVMINAVLAATILRRELSGLRPLASSSAKLPAWVTALHLVFLAAIVMASHHAVICMGIFLFFLGLVAVTKEFHDELKLRESLLVAFFLGGLVVLGGLQNWWLAPLLARFNPTPLFFGATALTAVTDNAALTFLGSQAQGLSPQFKYSLLAGAVTGGGLTVIANAPNPAGFSILQKTFGGRGISPLLLLASALIPTVICAAMFLLF